MPSVFIKTYGCQMNERDSEAVAAQLVARGYSLAKGEADADVILLNTCSVRDYAEQKAVGKMQNIAAEVRKNRPEVVLGFMGCMAKAAAVNSSINCRMLTWSSARKNSTARLNTWTRFLPARATKSSTSRKSRGARRRFANIC